MLAVRGVFDVIGGTFSDGAISGIAGLGHILVAAGVILFFCMLLLSLRAKENNKDEK